MANPRHRRRPAKVKGGLEELLFSFKTLHFPPKIADLQSHSMGIKEGRGYSSQVLLPTVTDSCGRVFGTDWKFLHLDSCGRAVRFTDVERRRQQRHTFPVEISDFLAHRLSVWPRHLVMASKRVLGLLCLLAPVAALTPRTGRVKSVLANAE
eukprot:scaffold600_cov279-Pinguiococcus_pyrenoidosus.AAC.1